MLLFSHALLLNLDCDSISMSELFEFVSLHGYIEWISDCFINSIEVLDTPLENPRLQFLKSMISLLGVIMHQMNDQLIDRKQKRNIIR